MGNSYEWERRTQVVWQKRGRWQPTKWHAWIGPNRGSLLSNVAEPTTPPVGAIVVGECVFWHENTTRLRQKEWSRLVGRGEG